MTSPTLPRPRVTIELAAGDRARDLLADPAFVAAWDALVDRCPWATVAQGSGFVRTWWRVYASRFELLIVRGLGDDGRLLGLLTLARRRDSGELVCAGDHHCEYQVWVSDPDHGQSFIVDALDALSAAYPAGRLGFLFLPPGTPVDLLRASSWAPRSDLRTHERPLMAVGPGTEAAEGMKGKNRARKLRALERIGDVRLEQLSTRAELEAVIGPIAAFTDIRQGAINGATPFRSDPLKEALYLALVETPGVLHATVLRVGKEVAATNLGLANRRDVTIGLITHSPFLARHSPGTVLIPMLGIRLGEQGYANLDLTPGGGYKERFATHHDTAYALDVFFGRAGWVRHVARQRAARMAKYALARAGLSPAATAAAVGSMMRRVRAPATLIRQARRRWSDRSEMRVYALEAAAAGPLQGSGVCRRDHLPDLFGDAPGPQAARLRAVLRRLEEGQHAYTRVEGGRLLHCGWLAERAAKIVVGPQQLELPQNAALLEEDATGAGPDPALREASIRQRIGDAVRVAGTEWVFVAAPAADAVLHRLVEASGFVHHASFFTETRRGTTRRWIELGGNRPAPGEPPGRPPLSAPHLLG